MTKNAGILFAHREGGRWEVCLARQAFEQGTGLLTSTGGRIKDGETPLDAAFRETKEEWFGGRDALKVEVQLADCLPTNFSRSLALPHLNHYPDGWEFHTFLVKLTQKFKLGRLTLNGEFVPGSASWFSANCLPEEVRHSTRRVIEHFRLDAEG